MRVDVEGFGTSAVPLGKPSWGPRRSIGDYSPRGQAIDGPQVVGGARRSSPPTLLEKRSRSAQWSLPKNPGGSQAAIRVPVRDNALDEAFPAPKWWSQEDCHVQPRARPWAPG